MQLPIQPIIKDKHGTVRFRANKIIEYLFQNREKGATLDLNQIAGMDFPVEDREQLAMLLGYSISGFGELSYVRSETYEAANRMATHPEKSELEARNEVLRETLAIVRDAARKIVPALFAIHPDDLEDR